jgi:hypothetical protein
MRSDSRGVQGVCSTGKPTGMLEITEVRSRLQSIAASLREAEAAADVMAEGDPSAAQELESELDAMAGDIAALKAGISSSF